MRVGRLREATLRLPGDRFRRIVPSVLENTTEELDEKQLRPHPVIPGHFESEAERQQLVERLFNESAPYYDSINRYMSFGTGSRYRRTALLRAGLTEGMSLLDVGCGTGVIAGHARKIVGETGQVIGVDPSEGMLATARSRGRISTSHVGKAEALPVEDDTCDMLTMGYALRHVNDLHTAFREYRRVLRPGGTVLILEITPPRSRIAFRMLKTYLSNVVPAITRLTTRSFEARELMSYYWETIEHCVPPETILDAMREMGFENVKRYVVLGMFSEYTGERPAGKGTTP